MSRARRNYTAPAVQTDARARVWLDADTPVEGYYRTRLRSGGVFVGVKIWFGQPLDPITLEPLDRSLRWNACVNDKPIDLDRVWPRCAREPVSAKEYAFLTAQQRWGEDQAPESPQADPTKRADPLKSPILF